MRSRGLRPVVGVLLAVAANAAIIACAPKYIGDEDGFDRGEATTASRPDATGGSSSSGSTPRADASSDVLDAQSDAAVVAGPCDPSHGVGAPVDLAGLASDDYRTTGRLSADERQIVFSQVRNPSNDNSPLDSYVASRGAVDQPFGAPVPVAAAVATYSPSFSADGLALYFTAKSSNGNGFLVATRTSTQGTFGAASGLTGVPQYGYSSTTTSDGQLLFSYFPNENPSTVQRGAVSPTGLGPTATLFAAASGNDVDFPTLSSDGSELFYAELPSANTYLYRRAVQQGDGSYVGASALPGLDETRDEVTWVSPDACRVYVTNWRDYRLTVATRLP